jgi:hypothetical protein
VAHLTCIQEHAVRILSAYDIWSSEGSEWVSAGKDVSTEVEDIVGIRYQAATGEDSKLRGLNELMGAL